VLTAKVEGERRGEEEREREEEEENRHGERAIWIWNDIVCLLMLFVVWTWRRETRHI
jgi:hypothetical protein